MNQPIREQLDAFFDTARLNLFFRARLAARGLAVDTIEIIRVQHRPKAGVTGLYRVSGRIGNSPAEHHYGITTETLKEQERHSVVPTTYAGFPVAVWRHPADPRLPGLPLATDAGTVGALWPQAFEQNTALQVSWRTYRPLRRAVLHVTAVNREAYLKVLTVKRAARLHRIHRIMADSPVPVAPLLGEPKAGIIALGSVEGQPLTDFLFHRDPGQLTAQLPFHRLTDVLDELPEGLMKLRPRASWTDGVGAYTRSAAAAFPALAERLQRVRKQLRKQLPQTDRGPLVPTHGDFYEANIFLRPRKADQLEVSGLLDLDTMGPGYRVDDLACLFGHLAVLPSVHERYNRIASLTKQWWAESVRAVDEQALQLRTAAVALTLIAGAKQAPAHKARAIAEQRLAVVEEILEGKKA